MTKFLAMLALAAVPFGFAFAGDSEKCGKKCEGDGAECEKCDQPCEGCPESALKSLAAARDERAKAAEAMKSLPAEKVKQIEDARKTIMELSPIAQSMTATMAATTRLLGVVQAIDAKAGLADQPCAKLAAELRSTLCEMMHQECAAADAADAEKALEAAEAAKKQAAGVPEAMKKVSDEQKAKVKEAYDLCSKECLYCKSCGSTMEKFGAAMKTLAGLDVAMPEGFDAKAWELRAQCLETAAALTEAGCCGGAGEDCCEEEATCPSEKKAGECPMTGKSAS